jgi:hypothetical protein
MNARRGRVAINARRQRAVRVDGIARYAIHRKFYRPAARQLQIVQLNLLAFGGHGDGLVG